MIEIRLSGTEKEIQDLISRLQSLNIRVFGRFKPYTNTDGTVRVYFKIKV